jgi:hypothetical protein
LDPNDYLSSADVREPRADDGGAPSMCQISHPS